MRHLPFGQLGLHLAACCRGGLHGMIIQSVADDKQAEPHSRSTRRSTSMGTLPAI